MTDEQLEKVLANCRSNKPFPTEYDVLEQRKKMKQQKKKQFQRTCPHCAKVCRTKYDWRTYHSDNCTKNLQQTENNCTTSD